MRNTFKIISAVMFSLVFTSVLSAEKESALIKDLLPGIWGMVPLRNGVSNVVEVTPEGKITLHIFNCSNNSRGESEVYSYKINKNKIKLTNKDAEFNLEIHSISSGAMSLIQGEDNEKLKFEYLKIQSITPLCQIDKKSHGIQGQIRISEIEPVQAGQRASGENYVHRRHFAARHASQCCLGFELNAGVGEKARSDARLILEGVLTMAQQSRTAKSDIAVWQSQSGSGSAELGSDPNSSSSRNSKSKMK